MDCLSLCAAPFFKNARFSILYNPLLLPAAPVFKLLVWRPTTLLFFSPNFALTSLGSAVLGGFGLGICTSRSGHYEKNEVEMVILRR